MKKEGLKQIISILVVSLVGILAFGILIMTNNQDPATPNPLDGGGGSGFTINIGSTQGEAAVNIVTEGPYQYGDSITVEALEQEGFRFLGWFDVARRDRFLSGNESYTFVVTENRSLEAKFVVLEDVYIHYVDINGEHLHTVLYEDWEVFNPSSLLDTLPMKPGYALVGWQISLGNVPEKPVNDVIIRPEYEKTDANTYTISGDGNQATKAFDEVFTITADETKGGDVFSHWEVDGIVFTYSRDLSFHVLKDTTIEAVYVDEVLKTGPNPVAYLLDLSYQHAFGSGYQLSFVGRYEVPEGVEVLEVGFLLAQGAAVNPRYDTPNVIRIPSSFQNQNGEFAAAKLNAMLFGNWHAIVYLVFDSGNGEERIYSEITRSHFIDDEWNPLVSSSLAYGDGNIDLPLVDSAIDGNIEWSLSENNVINDLGVVNYRHAYHYVTLTAIIDVQGHLVERSFDVFVSDEHVGKESMHAMADPGPDNRRSTWHVWVDRYWDADYSVRSIANESFAPLLSHTANFIGMTSENPAYLQYNIEDQHYSRVEGFVGISDNESRTNFPLEFKVYGDNLLLFHQRLEHGKKAIYYNLDLTDVNDIRFEWYAELLDGDYANRIVFVEPMFILFQEGLAAREIIDLMPEAVYSGDLTLPSTVPNADNTITWSSSNPSILDASTGVVTYPLSTTMVTLTAHYQVDGNSVSTDNVIEVIGSENSILQVSDVKHNTTNGQTVWFEAIVIDRLDWDSDYREWVLMDKTSKETIFMTRYLLGSTIGLIHPGDHILVQGEVSIIETGDNKGKLEVINVTSIHHFETNNPFRYGFDDNPLHSYDYKAGAVVISSQAEALDKFSAENIEFGTVYKLSGTIYMYHWNGTYRLHMNSGATAASGILYGGKRITLQDTYQRTKLGENWVSEQLGIDPATYPNGPSYPGKVYTGEIYFIIRFESNLYWNVSVLGVDDINLTPLT